MTMFACARHRCRPVALLAGCLCLSGFFAGSALAEGRLRILDCQITRHCDGAGQCAAGGEKVVFQMAPQHLDEGGAGSYQLSYGAPGQGEVKLPMTATSYAGPFLWSMAEERDTLLASSESLFLWHQLRLTPTPQATVSFLSCTLRQ
ncbi:hypothetical protein WH50_11045 [Pokkaliibacter plantistimulans]|uniref:C-type lysozyme inhibitor domain-containing protein n=1 Tax=Pokkaliibacter plantistimulans TaxID=1635171 RepID=A0ABX5LY95_9GAMM|nr:hypothetical protein [Pokkaliibacter plantistimulans]PXF31172.1 hypothetical protein WH50_11045 [Pokkaliibacter plantistimulans]